MNDGPSKPNPMQYVLYSYGRSVLPPSMHEWVANDLAGPRAALRTVVRFAIPCLLILIPFWFIDTSVLNRATMTLPIFIPFVYFSIALNKIYRRGRLRHHGLDPELVDVIAREKEADLHAAYIAKHGPRDEYPHHT
ncbi:DUF5313 domain-containing protein [Tsukamurella ocularis]|uniref:DUF5313 domain-containing protein n=1 Tax=Tsukamurella ocularis TaxID=1970234 RepID=UPI00216A5CD2|nr:DUF5313 domain-containing protein [Tsukamurella ocularis]MCS3779503.1 hypothetical protein [Tsukamurella ocularis]MCS3788024.1 hypothetical protein [Tsukamurella ocularis]MCS3852340.1 hypothetical protein [Tsukamurella ocularis]